MGRIIYIFFYRLAINSYFLIMLSFFRSFNAPSGVVYGGLQSAYAQPVQQPVQVCYFSWENFLSRRFSFFGSI